MRDIKDIIDELREHPDLVNNIGFLPIITMDDILYDINGQLEDIGKRIGRDLKEFTEVSYGDLTDNDMDFIRKHFMIKMDETWDNLGFRLSELPDLPTKLRRDIKIAKLLKEKDSQ